MSNKEKFHELYGYYKQEYNPSNFIKGVSITKLKRLKDETGSLTELIRMTSGSIDGIGCSDTSPFNIEQINFSELEANSIKAFHLHKLQTDLFFVPPSSKIKLVLVDVRSDSNITDPDINKIILGNGDSWLVRVPPGVAHGFQNLANSTSQIIYFINKQFSLNPS